VAEFKLDGHYGGGKEQQLLTQGNHLKNLTTEQSRSSQKRQRGQHSQRQSGTAGAGGNGGSSSSAEGKKTAAQNKTQTRGEGNETGITPANPRDQISLDDEEFDRF
jgi:hypothetical protein